MECPNPATGASHSTPPKRCLTSETIESDTPATKKRLVNQETITSKDISNSMLHSLSLECETLLQDLDSMEPTLNQDMVQQLKQEIIAEKKEDLDFVLDRASLGMVHRVVVR